MSGNAFMNPLALCIVIGVIFVIPVIAGLSAGSWLTFFITMLIELVIASLCYRISQNCRLNKPWWELF